MKVVGKLVYIAYVLCFLHYYHLVLGHHGIAFGGIDNCSHVHICAIYNGEVEFFFGFIQYVVRYIIRDEVDVLRFFAHQVIDGTILPGFQFP